MSRSDSSTAKRMRLHRWRQRHGLRSVRVQVSSGDLEGLVAKGYLTPGDRQDAKPVECAIYDLMNDWLYFPKG